MSSVIDKIPILGSNDTDDTENQDENSDAPRDNITDLEDDVLCDDSTYIVPDEMQVYRDKIVSDEKHMRTFVVDNWPPRIKQDILSGVIKSANLDFEFTLHLEPYDDNDAERKLESLADKLQDKRDGEFAKYTANKESIKNTEETLSAMKQHITQGEKLFDISMFVTLRADSDEELDRHTDELKNKLEREARIGINPCRYQQKEALVSNSPAGVHPLADKNKSFKQLMLSSGVSKLFPFIEDTFMESGGALFGINENSMTPIFLDIFDRSNGYNILTTGMVGSGKSFSTSQILMEMERAYPDLQQYIIDPMGGFQGVNNALDGDRIIIGGDESINPLEIQPTPEHVLKETQGKLDPWGMKKQEIKWFLKEFFRNQADNPMSGEEVSLLDRAITQTYHRFGITEDIETHSKDSPTLMDLIETLRMMAEDAEDFTDTNLEQEVEMRQTIAVSLIVKMEPFKPGGEYHNLAQETEIDITSNKTIYLDLQQIPEQSDNLGIMMQLLFMKIYQSAKSTTDKVALTLDEAHKLMGDESITGGLEELFRHSRHFDISINMLSQTPEEFYSTETAETIAKQCTIKRFHRVDKLNEDFAKQKLDLNNREIKFIENAEEGKGDKDYSEALLKIQDEDRSIPLRIEATRDEQIIIDYDPSEQVNEFDTKRDQKLKHALDVYNKNEDPVLIKDDDDLADQVRQNIVQKRRQRKRTLAQKDPSLLTEEEKAIAGVATNGDATSVDAASETPQSANSDDGNNADQEEEKEATADNVISKNFNNPEDIDNLTSTSLQTIASHYGVDVELDDESMKAKLKEEFFGIDADEVGSASEEPTGATNNDTLDGDAESGSKLVGEAPAGTAEASVDDLDSSENSGEDEASSKEEAEDVERLWDENQDEAVSTDGGDSE